MLQLKEYESFQNDREKKNTGRKKFKRQVIYKEN